jgi:Ca2+/Na+ antiporter
MLSDVFTWILMRFSCIDCTFLEVRQRQYQSERELVFPSEKVKICDEKIDFLKDKTKEVKDRRDRVDKKVQTLLTLTSLLLGLISSATSIASAKSIGFWSIVPLTLLFCTIFLLTFYFGVDRSQTTDYSYILSDLESELESANRQLCKDLISSQDYNERATNFMLDLYRSALRYFSLGMLFIMILGIGNILLTDSSWINSKDKVQAFFTEEFPALRKARGEVNLPSKTTKIAPSSVVQVQPSL